MFHYRLFVAYMQGSAHEGHRSLQNITHRHTQRHVLASLITVCCVQWCVKCCRCEY